MRKPNQKTKTLTVILSLILILTITIKLVNSTSSGSDFELYFETGSSLGFQYQTKNWTCTISTGILNGTNGLASSDYAGGGSLSFLSQDTANLEIITNINQIQAYINDVQVNDISDFSIIPNDNIRIDWTIPIEPWLPIMFIFGMIGLLCSFGGPLYAVKKIKQKEYYDGLRGGVVFTVLGMALVLAWLW